MFIWIWVDAYLVSIFHEKFRRLSNCVNKLWQRLLIVLKYTCIMCFLDGPNVTIEQCPPPLTEGENATLQCSATGNPVPNTAWMRQNTGVVSYDEILILPNIKRNESGSDDCLAWNGIGNNSTNSCTIVVECKLIFMFIVVEKLYINLIRASSLLAKEMHNITMCLLFENITRRMLCLFSSNSKQLITAVVSFSFFYYAYLKGCIVYHRNAKKPS